MLGSIISILKRKSNNENKLQQTFKNEININNEKYKYSTSSINTNNNKKMGILFIDDDTNFKIVHIIKNYGYINTNIIDDVSSLNDQFIINSHFIFVDVQGVGIKLGFKDEGLGLAEAIKDKYPDKIIVIYSAQTEGERFHKSLRKVDDFLPKNAEPYEFIQILEG